MTRDETVALFLECEAKRAEARAAALNAGKDARAAEKAAHMAAKAHWNGWAEALLARRKAMEADGRWKTKNAFGKLESANLQTRNWINAAAADFSNCLFLSPPKAGGAAEPSSQKFPSTPAQEPFAKTVCIEGDVASFEGFLFPGTANFAQAAFSCGTDFGISVFFDNARFISTSFAGSATFASATFSDDAYYANATFSSDATFVSASFSGNADFGGATFSKSAIFVSATFTKNADFGGAGFSGNATFDGAAFFQDAYFVGTAFSGNADFANCTLAADSIFVGATFKSSTSFTEANFQSDARFIGIKVERAFDMAGAKFAKVPFFNQADFKQAPDLDAVAFPLPGFRRKGDPGIIPLYRAIRRMAVQGSDYEREQMAFKGEIRCKRWTEHKPWHPAFWFGLAYDALSDFGRSIARPMAIGAASWLAFAAAYFWNAGVPLPEWGAACASDGAPRALKALTLSAANSLPLIGSSRGEIATQFYTGCLQLPHIPAWSPILQISQTLWSTVLIFLFLLALRNQFKIK
jgi:hypothetical protein